MALNHKVENVEQLLNDSQHLLNETTNGASGSAYSIIKNLSDAIDILSGCWKGLDAGVQINNIVNVYNNMVTFRNSMSDLSSYSYSIGIMYRQIQSSNGASVEVPSPLQDSISLTTKNPYEDKNDTIDITDKAVEARTELENAKSAFQDLTMTFNQDKSAILNNWTSGDRHDEFEETFGDFASKFQNYETLIADVVDKITSALANYGG